MELYATVQIFAGMLVLVAGSGLLVNSLVHLGRHFKLKEYLIVFILLGFGTTLPEFFIAINSIAVNAPDIAFGNAIGTSIASMTFIAGLIAVFGRNFKTDSFFEHHDVVHLTLSVILLFLLSYDGFLSLFDGLLLILVFVYYLFNLLEQKKQFKLKIKESSTGFGVHLVVAILSATSIYFAADYVLGAAVALKNFTGLSGFLIAVVLIAPLGIIPELILELELLKNKLSNLTFGDLFTSAVVNSTLIIGIVAVLKPFQVNPGNLVSFAIVFLILIMVVFNFFVRSKQELDWKEGLFLLFSYFFFIVTTFLLQF